jgi:hypothetical protein
VVAIVLGREDAAVICPLAVQALELAAIECENGSAKTVRPGKNLWIGRGCEAVLLHSDYIMANPH